MYVSMHSHQVSKSSVLFPANFGGSVSFILESLVLLDWGAGVCVCVLSIFFLSFLDLRELMLKVVVVDLRQYLPGVPVVVVPWPYLVLAQDLPFLRLFPIHLSVQ
jgi:hypothetical protein